MTDDVTDDDIRALRRDGDLSQYLRGLIRPTRHAPPARAGPEPTTHGPQHRPGAWPYGTNPANSAVCTPDCTCRPNPHSEPNGHTGPVRAPQHPEHPDGHRTPARPPHARTAPFPTPTTPTRRTP